MSHPSRQPSNDLGRSLTSTTARSQGYSYNQQQQYREPRAYGFSQQEQHREPRGYSFNAQEQHREPRGYSFNPQQQFREQDTASQNSQSRHDSQRTRRGTRGARRRPATQPQAQGKDITDPAARQQMKQTIAISMMTNPAFPLPFPLQIPLGLATLLCPEQSQKKRDGSLAPSEQR